MTRRHDTRHETRGTVTYPHRFAINCTATILCWPFAIAFSNAAFVLGRSTTRVRTEFHFSTPTDRFAADMTARRSDAFSVSNGVGLILTPPPPPPLPDAAAAVAVVLVAGFTLAAEAPDSLVLPLLRIELAVAANGDFRSPPIAGICYSVWSDNPTQQQTPNTHASIDQHHTMATRSTPIFINKHSRNHLDPSTRPQPRKQNFRFRLHSYAIFPFFRQ